MILVTGFTCHTDFGGGLFSIDPETHEVKKLLEGGFLGLATHKDSSTFFVVKCEGDKGQFRTLQKFSYPDIKPLWQIGLNSQTHGLCIYCGELYVVDTRGNKLLVYNLDLKLIKTYDFNPKKESITTTPDAFHLNDVFVADNEIYLSMFRCNINVPYPEPICLKLPPEMLDGFGVVTRLKKSSKGKSLGEPVITGLWQPHSVTGAEGWIFVCDSRRNMVISKHVNYLTAPPEICYKGPGYTRGLHFRNHDLWVGICYDRKDINKHECGVVCYGIEDIYKPTQRERFIPIQSSEIYAITEI